MITPLADVFERRAALAPDASPVLAAVRAGIRRRRRNRTAALTAASAIAASGLMYVVVLIPQNPTPTATSPTVGIQHSITASVGTRPDGLRVACGPHAGCGSRLRAV